MQEGSHERFWVPYQGTCLLLPWTWSILTTLTNSTDCVSSNKNFSLTVLEYGKSKTKVFVSPVPWRGPLLACSRPAAPCPCLARYRSIQRLVSSSAHGDNSSIEQIHPHGLLWGQEIPTDASCKGHHPKDQHRKFWGRCRLSIHDEYIWRPPGKMAETPPHLIVLEEALDGAKEYV